MSSVFSFKARWRKAALSNIRTQLVLSGLYFHMKKSCLPRNHILTEANTSDISAFSPPETTRACLRRPLLIFIVFLHLLFLALFPVALLQEAGLASQPLCHGRYHGGALPAAVLRHQEVDVTLGGEDSYGGLQRLLETGDGVCMGMEQGLFEEKGRGLNYERMAGFE